MSTPKVPASDSKIEECILAMRGQKVILDADLAKVYGVTTKALNQAVRRNKNRFPADFIFQLTIKEKEEVVTICDHLENLKFSYARPYAFTEHGAIMVATILNSPQAVKMSVFVVRAFVKMREILLAKDDLAKKLKDLEKKLTGRLDIHERAISNIIRQIMQLLNPRTEPAPDARPKKIGFKVKEKRGVYRTRRKQAVKK